MWIDRRRVRPSLLLLGFLTFLSVLHSQAQQSYPYYDHVFFDNSQEKDGYFYSEGRASEPSTLELVHGKLPVEAKVFHTPPNALRLQWTSKADGGWEAGIELVQFRDRGLTLSGSELTFWCFAPEAIPEGELPSMRLQDLERSFSVTLELSNYLRQMPAAKWVEVSVPLAKLASASIHAFDAHRLRRIIFFQSAPKGAHTLILDDFKIDNAAVTRRRAVAAPINVRAKGYERHVDVTWDAVPNGEVQSYVVYRSLNGGPFAPVGLQVAGIHRFMDWIGQPEQKAEYKVAAWDRALPGGDDVGGGDGFDAADDRR